MISVVEFFKVVIHFYWHRKSKVQLGNGSAIVNLHSVRLRYFSWQFDCLNFYYNPKIYAQWFQKNVFWIEEAAKRMVSDHLFIS